MPIWDHANKVAIISSIAGGVAVFGGLIYIFVSFEFRLNAFDARLGAVENRMNNLEMRMNKLETQQNTIKAAPEIVRDQPTNDMPPHAIPNPLIATCLELIHQDELALQRADIHTEVGVESRIKSLDCENVLKAQAPK
jgi:hypothetical protein